MAIPSGPKGTRDFYPEEMAFREFIFTTWDKTCKRYSFESFDAPMFEHLDLYTQKSGDEIEKQLYAFEDKGGRMIALRPELTPSLARMVAAKGPNLKRPIRWYSIPRLFRYEKMQKGRLREFFQLNMDILGIEDVSADAELIAAAIDMMRDLGFDSNDFKARISSRTMLEQAFSAVGVARELFPSLYALLDRKGKMDPSEFTKDLSLLLPESNVCSAVQGLFEATSLEEIRGRTGPLPALEDLEKLFELLGYYGLADYAMFDMGIVRGLAYYTGIVFELFDIKKSMRAIAGGGRYDKLVELYGGMTTPAVGFAAGDVVLGELLKEKGLVPTQAARSTVFLVSLEGTPISEIIALAQEIRKSGVSCEFSLKSVAVGKQLKNANAARSRFAIFVGGNEALTGVVRFKDMEDGSEVEIKKNEISQELNNRLSR